MAYVVSEICINCKYKDCIRVCPVDCFHEGENMVVIDQETCIDCGVCENKCPVNAIFPDTTEEGKKWAFLNDEYSQRWPNITKKANPPPDADDWRDVKNKYKDHFSSKPCKSENT